MSRTVRRTKGYKRWETKKWLNDRLTCSESHEEWIRNYYGLSPRIDKTKYPTLRDFAIYRIGTVDKVVKYIERFQRQMTTDIGSRKDKSKLRLKYYTKIVDNTHYKMQLARFKKHPDEADFYYEKKLGYGLWWYYD